MSIFRYNAIWPVFRHKRIVKSTLVNNYLLSATTPFALFAYTSFMMRSTTGKLARSYSVANYWNIGNTRKQSLK